jgi:tRNA (guanosine-2'-O-)-methyltransferase
MGYQKLHLVETQDKFKAANRVTQGTDKWLDIKKWTDPASCASQLKSEGYQIIVTHLDAAVPLDEIDVTKPTAIVLGNERDGVSAEMVKASDASVIIPMDGFAQSFNISVAAAISLYHIRLERLRLLGRHADLSDAEQEILRAHYYLRTVNHPEKLIEHALARME